MTQEEMFSYQVVTQPIDKSRGELVNRFTNEGKAVAFMVTQLRVGGLHIRLEHWDGKTWAVDNVATNKALAKVQGKGNAKAVSALTQLQEYTVTLTKQANTKNGVNADLGRIWLDQFYASCKALGFVPSALDAARSRTYQEPATAGAAQKA